MTIETKFDIGQNIFFLSDNKVSKGVVETIQIVMKLSEIDEHNLIPMLTPNIRYFIRREEGSQQYMPFDEDILFPNKEELLRSL